MNRANWIGAPEFFELNHACQTINAAFGWGTTYLVGSAIERRDHRDVDVRCILDDEAYAKLFPGIVGNNPAMDARWSLMCSAISLWLSKHTGLRIDFQIQQRTVANEENKDSPHRQVLGLFHEPKSET